MKKLTLGCGRLQLTLPPDVTSAEGWLSVDIRPDIQPDIVADFTRLHEFVDGESAGEIYSCHSLEHIDRESVVATLLSWWNVLETNGTLIIRVPNFPYHLHHWLNTPNDQKMFAWMNNIFGPGRDSQRHLNGFTPYSLQRFCEMAGFQTEFCDEFDSRYGSPKGDILYRGRKIDRSIENPRQWIPLCAWKPEPFHTNYKKIEKTNVIPFFFLLKKKYSESVLLYEEKNSIWCKRGENGNRLIAGENAFEDVRKILEYFQHKIRSQTQALIVYGDSTRFLPALLRSQIPQTGMPVLLIEPDAERLAVALAIHPLDSIPNDGRWQWVDRPPDRNQFETLANVMGLHLVNTEIVVDPTLPNSQQISSEIISILQQKRNQIPAQIRKLSSRSASGRERILIVANPCDFHSANIAQRCAHILQKDFQAETGLFLIEPRGFGSPAIGKTFLGSSILDVLSQYQPTRLFMIGLSPIDSLPAQMIQSLPLPIIFLQTTILPSAHVDRSRIQTIVSEKNLLHFMNDADDGSSVYAPFASDLEISPVPKEKERIVIYCEEPFGLSLLKKQALWSRFGNDANTIKLLAGLPFELANQEGINIYEFVREKWKDMALDDTIAILKYLICETSFIRQYEGLRRLHDLPVFLIASNWNEVLSPEDPLRGHLLTSPTAALNVHKMKSAQLALNSHSIARQTGPNAWFFRFPALGVHQICDHRSAFDDLLPSLSYFQSSEECRERILELLDKPDVCKNLLEESQIRVKENHLYQHRLQTLRAAIFEKPRLLP
ncbi:MAG: hypothetical protein C4527_04015 [Candidatus Omnitrophota bacterium]|jgi:predicted SAM-dependent methyltransferase|nr:MAG: hypothetical protein C4527_04015 [Candidatus Omnitrophota bacterium]